MPRRAVLGQRLPQVVPIAWMLVLVWWPPGDPLATWQRILAMAVVVAVIGGPFRRREVPWRDVRDITRARWTVDLTMHAADFETVRQWWLAHRG